MSQGVQQRADGSAANPNQIVHMRGDSDQNLELLFSVLKNVDGQQPNSSFRNRNLPASFFKPPPAGNHSREGSQDSSSFAPTQPQSGLSISHARSQSSPAQLPRTMTAAPPASHAKQQSVDLAEDLNSLQGWDVKQSPTNQQNQWQNPPNKSLSNSSLNSPQQTLSPNQSLGASPNVSLQDLGPLPAGWEQSTTENGEIYFINHIEKATSWFDPRIPKHLQRPGPMKIQQQPQLPPQQQQPPQPPPQPRPSDCLQQQQQQQANTHASHMSQSGGQQLAQPSPQQQQQLSPNNHQNSTPQLQPQMQRKPVPNEQYIKLEFQKLERDKERLRREQEEIQKRELKLKNLLKDMASVLTPSTANDPIADGMGAQSPMHATGVDPFLGHGGNITDNHARQNSGDSGLGGMNNYSLPRTPEDILSNVDEMDTQEGGKLHKHMNSDFNMNDLQGTMTGMDMNLGEATNNPTGMDSDDLVPSLQEDIGTALLNDMEVQKMENLLWL